MFVFGFIECIVFIEFIVFIGPVKSSALIFYEFNPDTIFRTYGAGGQKVC